MKEEEETIGKIKKGSDLAREKFTLVSDKLSSLILDIKGKETSHRESGEGYSKSKREESFQFSNKNAKFAEGDVSSQNQSNPFTRWTQPLVEADENSNPKSFQSIGNDIFINFDCLNIDQTFSSVAHWLSH